jgi:hypothetical protein
MAQNERVNGSDVFTKFWTDYMSRMGSAGMPIPSMPDSSESARQMQRMLFEAMAKYADDFMRSPQFLEAMRQSLDNALAFRHQINEFLTNALHASQSPSRSDVDELVALVRNVEERILDRVEALERRLEPRTPAQPAPPKAPTPPPAAKDRPAAAPARPKGKK